MFRPLALIVLTLSTFSLTAQISLPNLSRTEEYNFVPDPSFELTRSEPCGWNQGIGSFEDWMNLWTSPTQTTPDLFSTRVKNSCWSHPAKHSDNRQRPKDGDNMVGIKCFGTGGTDTYWHEYVQIELEESLKKDTLYYIEFYANAAHKASRICNNIGAVVQQEAINTRDRKPIYITPTINSEKLIKQSLLGWKRINGVFKAHGDEQFIIIGNFYRDEETRTERLDTGKDGAYYYIDEVMLRRARSGEKVSPRPKESRPPENLMFIDERATTEDIVMQEVQFDEGTIIELKNIQFEFDKAELHPSSQTELNELAHVLLDNPFMQIEITGHTDDVGEESYNQRLSEARAQAVVAYLIHKNVEQERLEFKGMGSIMPVASNSTEEGRIANRRVEFEVISN